MRGEKTLQILELIGYAAINTIDLTIAILNAGYGASHGKIQYELSKQQHHRFIKQKENKLRKEKIALKKQTQQRIYEILYKLKKDGLVEEIKKNDKKLFHLTLKGRKKLENLKIKNKNALPDSSSYKRINSDKFIIITFDIPEEQRRKRDWLREVLKNLGLKFVQKSVWMGKIKLSLELLEDLRKLNLLEFVEIFEVGKTGTLRQIT